MNKWTLNKRTFGYKWTLNLCAPDTIFTLIHYMHKFHLTLNNQDILINIINDTNGSYINNIHWHSLIFDTVIDNNTLYVENQFMNIVRIIDFYLLSVTNEIFFLDSGLITDAIIIIKIISLIKDIIVYVLKKMSIVDTIQSVINDYIYRQFIITECQSCFGNIRGNHDN